VLFIDIKLTKNSYRFNQRIDEWH